MKYSKIIHVRTTGNLYEKMCIHDIVCGTWDSAGLFTHQLFVSKYI
jgi:hypothetical protein